MPRTTTLSLGIVLSLLWITTSAPWPAQADSSSVYRRLKGQIIVSDVALPPPDRGDPEGFKRAHKSTLARADGEERWQFRFVGFLAKQPPSPQINLVFYALSGGKREYVSNVQINMEEESIIVVSEASVSEEDGIKPGGKYDVVLGQMVDGKETVFAKTVLTFK